MSMFQEMYEPDLRDRTIFTKHLVEHGRFGERGEWQLVAVVRKTQDDGRDVEIDECRLPDRCFRLSVSGSPGLAISTGSGDAMGRLMVTLAEQIAEGMVSVERVGE